MTRLTHFLTLPGHYPDLYLSSLFTQVITLVLLYTQWLILRIDMSRQMSQANIPTRLHMSLVVRNPVFSGFPTMSHTLRTVQPVFSYFEFFYVDGLYFLCSENNGADQQYGYRTADLRFCFRICTKPIFS